MLDIPETSLKKLFIITNLRSRGTGSGENVLHTMVDYDSPPYFFELSPDNLTLDLSVPQLDVRTSNDNYSKLHKDGAWTGWRLSFPIVRNSTRKGAQSYLIDFEDFALRKAFLVQGAIPQFIKQYGAFRGRLVSVRNFPRNMLFEVQYGATDPTGDFRLDMGVALAVLPDQPMTSRVKDDRIGYFTTQYTDIGVHPETRSKSRPLDRVDPHVSLINRWRLGDPANVTLSNSSHSPMVYYIDPTIPEKWRPYFKRGVEVWQPAFRKLGYENLPRAVLPTDPDFPADYDAADMRYSSISFAVSRTYTFAVGPSVVDPRTGEILNADIGFAQEWVHAWTGDITFLGSTDSNSAHSHAHTCQREEEATSNQQDNHKGNHHHHHKKRFYEDNMHDRELLRLAFDFSGQQVPDEVIGAGLADVTAHEVGHTLGLRHNFKGSTSTPFNKLHDKEYTYEHGLSSSVMDYIPININKDPAKQGYYFTGNIRVGAYDEWAIEYGYTYLQDEISGIQHPQLQAIATEGESKSNIAFASDGDAYIAQDPKAKRYDLSDDPIAYAAGEMDLVETLRSKAPGLLDRSVKPGESYLRYWQAERVLLHHAYRRAKDAATYIGGVDISRSHRASTGGGSVSLVNSMPAAYQSAALDVVRRFFGNLSAQLTLPEAFHQYVSREQGSDFSVEMVDLGEQRNLYLSALMTTLLDSERLGRLQGTLGSTHLSKFLRNVTGFVLGTDCAKASEDVCTSLTRREQTWPTVSKYVSYLLEHSRCDSTTTPACSAVTAALRMELNHIAGQCFLPSIAAQNGKGTTSIGGDSGFSVLSENAPLCAHYMQGLVGMISKRK